MIDNEALAAVKEKMVKFYMRHVTPLFFVFGNHPVPHTMPMTAFVLSVADQWFLVTAGHCLKEVQENIASYGEITQCYLVDYMGLDARDVHPIDFDYKHSHPVAIIDENIGYDYGVIPLSLYYRKLLEVNNVQPLSEKAWKYPPSKADLYTLLGIPKEFVKIRPHQARIEPAFYLVKRLEERPHKEFSETQLPQFWGSVRKNDMLTSFKGMSGGPIFAFYTDSEGQQCYWIAALQTRQVTNTPFIAGCFTKWLGDAIERVMALTTQENENQHDA